MQNLGAQRGNDLQFRRMAKRYVGEVREDEEIGKEEQGNDSRGGIAATEYFVVVRGFAPLWSTRYSELSQ